MELQTVDIKVSKALKQYVVSTNGGSDCITPGKDSVLWGLLKQYLVSNKIGMMSIPEPLRKDFIRISLRNAYNARTYNRPSRKVMQINVVCRASLLPAGARAIARMLDKEFKKSFIDYMKGCLNNAADITIKDAIEEFCLDHNMDCDPTSYEMLKKYWYRWKMKPPQMKNCSVNY